MLLQINLSSTRVHMTFKLCIVFVLILIGSACAGPTDHHAQNSSSPEVPQASMNASEEAYALFTKAKCVSCHGQQLEGRVGEVTNLQNIASRRTVDDIMLKIQKGGNGMPGYEQKLSNEEIKLLANWLYRQAK